MSADLGTVEAVSQRAIRAYARWLVRSRLTLRVEGLEHLPRTGPLLIVARHYHHLYDAVVLLAVAPRPLHFLVALDWVSGPWQRRLMETACAAARWPVVLRPEALAWRLAQPDRPPSAYRPGQEWALARRASREVAALARAGRALVVFPEGYPNVDPEFSPKTRPEQILPFRPGFVRLAVRTERAIGRPLPLLPAGLAYRPGRRWQATLRLGRPTLLAAHPTPRALARRLEAEVRALSRS